MPRLGTIFKYVGEQTEVYKCPEDVRDQVSERPETGEIRNDTLYSYTSPTILTGAPISLLLRTRWMSDRYADDPAEHYRQGLAKDHSMPWMIIEEDEGWYLAFVTDSAWGNDDRISDRHDGAGNIANVDGSVFPRKFSRELIFRAWNVYYELTDGRVVSAGQWSDRPTFGYLTRPGIGAEVSVD